MMTPSFTVRPEGHRATRGLRLQGGCSSPTDAAHLVAAAKQLLAEGVSTLWMDCQQVQVVDRCGQEAILQIEHLAARARVTVYWQGFSEPVVQQLSSTGLYLLLHHSPIAHRSQYFD